MDELLLTYEEKMEKTIKALLSEYVSIRAGRANPHVLDKLRVDYYGVPSTIQQVANVSVPEPRMLMIHPWEKSLLKLIEKAILTSDIGINPQNDGRVIRLVFPQLTEEKRKELAKEVRKTAEDSKVAVRSIRRECMDKIKKMEKNSEITEDDLKIGEKKLQDVTDEFIKKIDVACADKEKDILEI